MSIQLDLRELREFEKDVSAIPGQLNRHVIPVLKRGAVQVKRQLTEDMRRSKHFARFATFRFEIEENPGQYVASIFPDTDNPRGRGRPYKRNFSDGRSQRPAPTKGPGAGANIAYFGTSRGGGSVRDPFIALQEEAPKFEQALAELVEKLI